LGTGTADNTTYLRGDGTWATVSGGSGSIPHATASGTDTYTATLTGVTAYNDGDAFLIRFTNGNTTGSTLNINSLGAVTLYRNNDGPIIGGDIENGAEMLCIYNSTISGFQLIGTTPNTLISYVTNADSVTITKGQPVYAFGGQGDRLTVKLAYNTTDATSAQTVGIVASTSIAAGQKGFIIVNGLLDGLSILPTSTWADGDPIYLGATAGTITNVKPVAPNHLVYLGFVTTANNGSAGRMYVRVQNGYELNELHDVQVGSYGTKDVLWRDTSTNLWKNKDVFTLLGAASSSANGYLTSTDWTTFNGKQDALVSGVNIKTINSNSILGSGNLAITTSLTVGTTPISSGTIGRVLFENGGNVLGEDAALFWDNTNKRLGVGATPASTVRLDVRAQGALSTDIGFRVRNSADTANLFDVQGDGMANVRTRMTCGFSGMTTTGGALYVYAGNNADFVSRWFNTAGISIMNLRTTGDGARLALCNASGNEGIVLNGIFSDALTFGAGRDIYFDTATGTKIGAATNQKFAFWNKTPIVQPTTAIGSATRAGTGGTNLTTNTTFDGYTLAQVVLALRNIGLLA
jgi:hypothetical protein